MISAAELRTALWHLRKGGLRQLDEWIHRRGAQNRGPQIVPSWRAPKFPLSRLRARPTFAPYTFPQRKPRRGDVTVGVILDEFSVAAFSFEWNLVLLRKESWLQQLKDERIDFLFVESAWNGNFGSWKFQLTGDAGPKPDFLALIEWCRSHGVPTVFWNKEDPPHYKDFLSAARQFDVVFTSDAGRIPSYVLDLGHARVATLPFAAQPALHNPIRGNTRRQDRGVAFAGMYFAHKYPERREQMDMLLSAAINVQDRSGSALEIFSRQLGARSDYQFPPPYDQNVVGSLDYARMLSAYRAYKVFLNVNSVIDSPSMCARRIFEITASGTPVVSAPSAAIPKFFEADEVFVATSREQAEHQIRMLVRSPELSDRLVHKAQRRIWEGHTYAHRAESILQAVLPARSRQVAMPTVSAMVSSIRMHKLESVFATLGSQTGVDVELTLLAHGFKPDPGQLKEWAAHYGVSNYQVITAGPETLLGDCLNRCVDSANGEVLTKMDDDDYYGPAYLADLLHSLDFSKAEIVGKLAHYVHFEATGATVLRMPEREHTFTHLVMGPTITGKSEVFRANPFEPVPRGEDTAFLRSVSRSGGAIYASDRFNFCQVRSGDAHTWNVSDEELAASGEVKFFGNPKEHVSV